MAKGGYYFEDDGSPTVSHEKIMTCEELARFALDEAYLFDLEPPIGLDPHLFTGEEYYAIPNIKFELWDGGLFDDDQGPRNHGPRAAGQYGPTRVRQTGTTRVLARSAGGRATCMNR